MGFVSYAVLPASSCYVVPEASPQVTALLISGLLAYAMVWETLDAQPGMVWVEGDASSRVLAVDSVTSTWLPISY